MNNTPFEPVDAPTEPTPVAPGALEVMERAQIDLQIATAKRYPRTLSKVKAEMLTFATLDEETASSCFYTLPRGGKVIRGPSVRLAEIAFSCWTNVRAATRILETVTDGATPHVVVQSMAFDLEKNTSVMMEKRRRITKKKAKAAPDEDDINLAANACAAIAFRDAVLKVVPKALITPVCEAAMRVAVGEVKSLVSKRTAVIKRLNQMGITEDRILAVVECAKVEDIGLDQLGTLIGLGTALKDGELTIEEAFPPIAPAPKTPAFPKVAAEPPDDIPMETAAPRSPEKTPDVAPGRTIERGGAVAIPPESTVEPRTAETVPAGGPVLSSSHQELEAFMDEHGISFDALQRWATETQWEPGFDSYGSLAEMPPKSVQRLLRSKAGLIKQFSAAKA